ncbi:PEP-utilizing enzyme [Myxococcota bacterium]|nr:PEP-utilizing enzyme [Myxococcota bacterium]
MILHLDDASGLEAPEQLCGGKWRGLARLRAMGARVPESLCVTADAYRQFAAHAGLEEATAQLRALDEDGRAEKSASLRVRIEDETQMPTDLASLLRNECERFTEFGPLAVRSSATSEDRDDASSAGQYDTFLGVQGLEATLEAIRRCWSSLWSDHAIAYRTRMGHNEPSVAMAVIVQRLVPADVAGVAFTRHPVEDRSEILIEACRGLGDDLVSGRVNPDRFEIDRSTGTWTRVADAGQTNLDSRQLRTMRDIFLEIEQQFGCAVDLEWAWQGEELFLLQARPITTRVTPPLPSHETQHEDLTGTAASPGTVTGPARVLLDPDVAELIDGDVLVASFTDPRWTRHFRRAAGLITERGGLLSHGAILARECGIPAVVGVEGATQRIPQGNHVTLNGDRGTVGIG